MSKNIHLRESARIAAMARSGIREVMDLAWSLDGVNHLEVGEPDFETPQFIADAAIKAIREHETKYSPNAGIQMLRSRLVQKVSEVNGLHCDESQVVVSSGAVQALFVSLTTILNHGDQILLPDPGWPNFRMMCSLLDVEPVFYPLRHESNFVPQIDELDQCLTPRVKAILINSPSNPLGVVMGKEDLEAIVNFATTHGLWIISDECYDQIAFEKKCTSIASIDGCNNVISAFSFSKTYAMTGWRVGYAIVPREISSAVAKTQEPIISCVNTPSQFAALAALNGDQAIVVKMVSEYRKRRDSALALARSLNLDVFRPSGAFYLWAKISDSGLTSRNFSLELLHKKRIAVAPGTAFGRNGEGWVRISLASEQEKVIAGVQAVSDLIKELV